MAFDPDAYLASAGGFDPDAYLASAKPQQKPGIADYLNAAKEAAALPISAMTGLSQQIGNDPAAALRKYGAAFPITGGAFGGPIGAASGEFAREMLGTAIAPDTVPQSGLGRFAATAGAGVLQDPKILEAIPGVPAVKQLVSNLASKAGNVAAKVGEALTGAKAKDLQQAAQQGLSTYAAPSMDQAGKTFGEAMEQEGIPGRSPLKQIIDPQLATARKVALEVGGKLQNGVDVGVGDALRARQALDRIYNATPLLDRSTRAGLADLRTAMDDIVSNKSGALANASTLYRQAIVKSNLLNPFRITKQGQYSAVAPMVATLAATAGLGSGHKGESGLGALGYLAASSPAVAGALAAGGGSAANAFGALAARPEVRQALMQLLMQMKKQPQSPAAPAQ